MAPPQKPGRSKQDYGTPVAFLTAVKKFLHIDEFAIDLAASRENTVAPRYYDKAMNALVQPWGRVDGQSMWVTGEYNWLNPEYANIGPWAQRAYEQARTHNAQTAMLIPASIGANWWREWVHRKATVIGLNGRLTFVGCEDPYPKDCALLLYSPCSAGQYAVWEWTKADKVPVF